MRIVVVVAGVDVNRRNDWMHHAFGGFQLDNRKLVGLDASIHLLQRWYVAADTMRREKDQNRTLHNKT